MGTSSRYAILDLDSTLLYARNLDLSQECEEDDRNFCIRPAGNGSIMQVTIRKHVKWFLDELRRRGYKIIVWSAGIDQYVKAIVSVVFRGVHLEYVFTRNHTREPEEYKDLSIVKDYVPDFSLSRGRLIDDNPGHVVGQEGYVIIVKPFIVDGMIPTAQEDDDFLLGVPDMVDQSMKDP